MNRYDQARASYSKRFFSQISRMINCEVPPHLRNILTTYGLDQPVLLGKAGVEHMKDLEKFVSSDNYCIPVGSDMKYFLGPRVIGAKETFTFNKTEQDLLNLLSTVCRKHSDSWWCKKLNMKDLYAEMEGEGEIVIDVDNPRGNRNDQNSLREDNIEAAIEDEVFRVHEIMRKTTSNETVHGIFDSLTVSIKHQQIMDANGTRSYSGKIVGRIECTCQQKYKIHREGSKSWNIGNFSRHYWDKHAPSEGAGRNEVKRRNTRKRQNGTEKNGESPILRLGESASRSFEDDSGIQDDISIASRTYDTEGLAGTEAETILESPIQALPIGGSDNLNLPNAGTSTDGSIQVQTETEYAQLTPLHVA